MYTVETLVMETVPLQPGVASVYCSIVQQTRNGVELYVREFSELVGMTFREIRYACSGHLLCLQHAGWQCTLLSWCVSALCCQSWRVHEAHALCKVADEIGAIACAGGDLILLWLLASWRDQGI